MRFYLPSLRKINLLALACVSSACTSLQTAYQEPAIDLPRNWSTQVLSGQNEEKIAQPLSETAWWKEVDDIALRSLIEIALRENSNLADAAWKIQQARYSLGLSRDDQTPKISSGASSAWQHSFDSGGASKTHSLSVNLSYELDLWGRLASKTNAQEWRLFASQQDLQTAAIALVANVAQLYWRLGYQNSQISSGEKSLQHTQRTQKIVQAQYQNGAVSALELQESLRSVASQQASLDQLRVTRSQTRNALSIILNRAPSQDIFTQIGLPEPLQLPTQSMPSIAAGIPAEVLARRPDLRAAQANLRAMLAETDALQASFYPNISLTANAGSSSSALSDILANPVGSLAASLTLPFLQYTQIRLSTASAKAGYEAAREKFIQSLLIALQEVEDTLNEHQQLQTQNQWLQQQLQAAAEVERLNELRYRAGSTALKVWLDAQESRRIAQLQLLANQYAQLNNHLMLYKALGGDAELPAPKINLPE